jgi:anti-anti-sigma factor
VPNLTINRLDATGPQSRREVTLALAGVLDNSTAPLLDNPLAEALAGQPAVLRFDLGGLQLVTSAGIRRFAQALKQQKARQAVTEFLHPQPPVRDALAMCLIPLHSPSPPHP